MNGFTFAAQTNVKLAKFTTQDEFKITVYVVILKQVKLQLLLRKKKFKMSYKLQRT